MKRILEALKNQTPEDLRSGRSLAPTLALMLLATVTGAATLSCGNAPTGTNNNTGNSAATANSNTTSSGYIDIVGQWKGDTRGMPTTLVISSHSGETFSGTKIVGDYRVSVAGMIDPQTKQITIRDAYVEKGKSDFPLGVGTGFMSADGRSITGEWKDKRGAYQFTYTR